MAKKFKKWVLKERYLENLTPEKARDFLIDCVFTAHLDGFKRSLKHIETIKDDDIRENAAAVLYALFHDIGGNFDYPSKKSMVRVIGRLSQAEENWGTPRDLVEHHRGQLLRLISTLP